MKVWGCSMNIVFLLGGGDNYNKNEVRIMGM